MIIPSEKLKQFVALFEQRRMLCEKMGVDETVMTKLLSGDRGASAKMIEQVWRYTGWKFEDAWVVVEGDEG